MTLDLVTAPTEEPVTLQEAKDHLRIDHTDEDIYLATLIKASRKIVEKLLNKTLITQTWDLYEDAFPGTPYDVPLPPLSSVTSIIYTDSDDDETTVTATTYVVDAKSQPGRINLAYGMSWPSTTLTTLNAVKIRYIAGYGDALDVPDEYKQAVLMLIGHFYENREATTDLRNLEQVPIGVYDILGIDRVYVFP